MPRSIADECPVAEWNSLEISVAHEANSVLSLLTIGSDGDFLTRNTTRLTEVPAMDFSLIDYLDEDACYAKLVDLLHPDGLACPQCGERQCLGIHRRHREPVLDYQCGTCGGVFNAWTGTSLTRNAAPPRGDPDDRSRRRPGDTDGPDGPGTGV